MYVIMGCTQSIPPSKLESPTEYETELLKKFIEDCCTVDPTVECRLGDFLRYFEVYLMAKTYEQSDRTPLTAMKTIYKHLSQMMKPSYGLDAYYVKKGGRQVLTFNFDLTCKIQGLRVNRTVPNEEWKDVFRREYIGYIHNQYLKQFLIERCVLDTKCQTLRHDIIRKFAEFLSEHGRESCIKAAEDAVQTELDPIFGFNSTHYSGIALVSDAFRNTVQNLGISVAKNNDVVVGTPVIADA